MRATEDIFQDELCAWLALHHAPGVPSQAALALVETAGSAVAALRRLRSAPPVGLEPARAWLDNEAVGLCAEAKCWAGPDRRVLVYSDPCYPPLLRKLAAPPLALYVAGDVASLVRPQVAVVGSRSASGAGLRIARQLADALARAGLVVTAGLAVGIDGSAHRGALAAGGRTIAVLGSGLQRIYPGSHSRLAVELAASGALVSEFSLKAAPLPRHFPQRNRLISGLSLGVVVVEATIRSGSLITARHALDQGRELFAVPGSIHNPLARGCHRLLRDGACLVESAADILEELGLPAAPTPEESAQAEAPLPASMQEFLEHVGFSPVLPEALAESSGLTIAEISSMLIDLEIRGYVCSQNDGNYCRIR